MYNQQLLVLTVLLLIILGILYTRSFENDVPTCDGYVTNVYLYVLLGLLIVAFSLVFISKRKYAITNVKKLVAFIIAMVAMFSIFSIKPRNVLLNHLVWLVFVISMSVMMYSIWRYSEYRGVLTSSMMSVAVIFGLLTAISFMRPDLIKLSWISGLTVALFAGILASIIPFFFESARTTGYQKALSAFLVFVFMMLIMYDTKFLIEKSKVCTYPDYPQDSLGLFLDVLNLFNNVTVLNN